MDAAGAACEDGVVRNPLDVSAWAAYLLWRRDAPLVPVRAAVYERALSHLPGSYKLWSAYLGELSRECRGREPGHALLAATDAAFERALLYLGKMPRLWLDYLAHLEAQGLVTRARRTYERALLALPVTQHERIWAPYVALAERLAQDVPQLGARVVFPRYEQFNPRSKERHVEFLLAAGEPLAAIAKLGALAADRGFVSAEGRSPHDMWLRLCELLVRHAPAAWAAGRGVVDPDALLRAGISRFPDEGGRLWAALAEFHVRRGAFECAEAVYEEALEAVRSVRDLAAVFDAYAQFQEGMLGAKVELFGDDDGGAGNADEEGAFYDVNADAEDKVNDVDLRLARFERLMEQRPFLLSQVVLRQNPHNVDEWHARAELFRKAGDLPGVVTTYQRAVDTVNPALALGDPHSLWTALARVYEEGGDVDEARAVLETALETPFRSPEELVAVYGALVEMELRLGRPEAALALARRALTPPQRRQALERLNVARQQRAKGKAEPAEPTEQQADADAGANADAGEAESPTEDGSAEEKAGTEVVAAAREKTRLQQRLYKSPGMWALLCDLEESLGSLEACRAAYERTLELKVATPQSVLNYAALLEERRFFEDAFRAFERGLQLFPAWPHCGELWLAYLSRFLARHPHGDKLFRTRELFAQATAAAPGEGLGRALLLLQADMEERVGDPRKALDALDKLCLAAPPAAKVEVWLFMAAKAEELFGIARAREVLSRAIELSEEPATVRELCLRFAEKERRLGEVDRARAVLRHGAAHADPRTVVSYWRAWNDFEVAHGNEDTFRAMLRVKATVAQQYKSTNYAIAAPEAPGAAATDDNQGASDDVQADGHGAPGPLKRDLVDAAEEDWARETSAPGKRARLRGAPEDEDEEEGEQQQPQPQPQQREGDAGVRRVQVPSTLFGDAMAKAAEERAAARQGVSSKQ